MAVTVAISLTACQHPARAPVSPTHEPSLQPELTTPPADLGAQVINWGHDPEFDGAVEQIGATVSADTPPQKLTVPNRDDYLWEQPTTAADAVDDIEVLRVALLRTEDSGQASGAFVALSASASDPWNIYFLGDSGYSEGTGGGADWDVSLSLRTEKVFDDRPSVIVTVTRTVRDFRKATGPDDPEEGQTNFESEHELDFVFAPDGRSLRAVFLKRVKVDGNVAGAEDTDTLGAPRYLGNGTVEICRDGVAKLIDLRVEFHDENRSPIKDVPELECER